nr:MAG TPA: hypothetical protein [Bacteriophage sp.]
MKSVVQNISNIYNFIDSTKEITFKSRRNRILILTGEWVGPP